MKVRGTVIVSIDKYVKDKYPAQYETWKSKLDTESKTQFEAPVGSKWYPVEPSVIQPTLALCDMFHENIKEGSWESGRYSAEVALTGIYKVFVVISTPSFLMKRASRILSTFYDPSELKVTTHSDKSMSIDVYKLPINNEIIEFRIAGWMQKALEICGCKNVQIQISKALSKGEDLTRYNITWQ